MKSKEEFYKEMSDKITASREQFNDALPFTVMSERVLEPEYEPEYGNVYQKGALISMCLDLILRKNSEGKYGIIDLVNDLSKVYGSEKPFKDDELFDQIEKMKGKEVRAFLDTYVAGTSPLPIEEVLSWAGVDFLSEAQSGDSTVSLGSIGLGLNEKQQLMVADNSHMNAFGKMMGYENGDVLLAINGNKIELPTFQMMLDGLNKNSNSGDPITITVLRGKEDQKEIQLQGKVMKMAKVERNVLRDNPNATAGQIKLREAWLSAK